MRAKWADTVALYAGIEAALKHDLQIDVDRQSARRQVCAASDDQSLGYVPITQLPKAAGG